MKSIRLLFYVYFSGLLVATLFPFGEATQVLDTVYILSLRLDHLLHILVFFPLIPIWLTLWPASNKWLVFALGLFIAAAAEGMHYVLPYRAFNANDMLANIAGVIAGMLLHPVLRTLLKKLCNE